MGSLRDRMERDLRLATFSPATTRVYLHYARDFAAHYMRPPSEMGGEEVRDYLLHLLVDRKLSHESYRQGYAALKFLYRVTLDRAFDVASIPRPKKPRVLPDVLSGSEVVALLRAVRKLSHKAVICCLYGAGLRVLEACRLEVRDIDSRRELIHVRHGKGNADRYVMLSHRLLEILREHWRVARPQVYLFPARTKTGHVPPDTIRKTVRRAAVDAGLKKRVTPHLLRHCFATHALEAGIDIGVIQALLGHRDVRATMAYTQLRPDHIKRVKSPLDLLGTDEAAILG